MPTGITYWDGSAEQSVTLSVWNGTEEISASTEVVPGGASGFTIDNLVGTQPFYIAHRGGSESWPEMTLYAYEQAAAWPMKALEVSFWISSDGVLVASHDQNTSRVTGSSHDIPTTTWATLSTLQVSASATNNPGQSSRPLARVTDILDEFAASHVIFVEDKHGTSWSTLNTLLSTYPDHLDHFVIKIYGGSTGGVNYSNTASAAGYKTWGYFFQADMAVYNTNYSAFDYVGLDFNSTDATITGAVATATGAGILPIGHIIDTAVRRDKMLTDGCVGIMASDIQAVVPH